MVVGEQEVEMERQSARLQEQLLRGARSMGIEVDGPAADRLIGYLALLSKWNKTYNLTAIEDPDQMVSHHLLDSLAICQHVSGKRVLDVGSGAGLPGIPLAIMLPEKTFVLLDSNGKKTRFLVQAVAELKLDNVEVVNERVEQYRDPQPFDSITARAYASMNQLLQQTHHLCAPGGRYLFMKGRQPTHEIAEIGPGYRVVESILLEVPGIAGQRRLIIVEPR